MALRDVASIDFPIGLSKILSQVRKLSLAP